MFLNPRLGSTEEGLEEGLAEEVGKGLAKGWRRAGEGLAKGWQRVGGLPCTLQLCSSGGARLEDWVRDSMVVGSNFEVHVLCACLI